jgi:hypothetical protein
MDNNNALYSKKSDDQYIYIDIDVFVQFRKNHTVPINHIQSKADLLQNSYGCFQESTDTLNNSILTNSYSDSKNKHSYSSGNQKWGKNTGSYTRSASSNKFVPMNTDKVRSIERKELTKEDRTKREFMAFINKLSEGTRKNISTYCNKNLQPEFIEIYLRLLWEAMLRCEQFSIIIYRMFK